MTEEPVAYKFVGTYYTWLIEEYCTEDEELDECQPVYAPIEDEE